ncbi:MAG: rRNA maturation RNase YbeY [Bacteroidales bacterium]|nr:rRNA maturation RNase YbeY [Bacteroidales bacterium]
MAIHFSFQDNINALFEEKKVSEWICRVIRHYGKVPGKINYLFSSDEYVHDVNVRFLNHDTYTDIITFDNVVGDRISGDIIISIDRVGENAALFENTFDEELRRVIIHGVLHLLGNKDKTDEEAKNMRKLENDALKMFVGE